MPNPETSDLHQKAVYWARVTTGALNDRYGEKIVVSANVEIPVRWEIKQGEVLDADSNVILFDEIAVVDRVIPVGSILWLGLLKDIETPPIDLKEVIDYSEIPDVKNRNSRKVVKMIRYSNELPEPV